jgi:hypothetical protein
MDFLSSSRQMQEYYFKLGYLLLFLVYILSNSLLNKKKNKLRGLSPQSELYRPSDRRLSAKLVPTLANRGCRVVSATNPHGR